MFMVVSVAHGVCLSAVLRRAVRMWVDAHAEYDFAGIGYERIADGSHADGADTPDHQDKDESAFAGIEMKQRGDHYRAQKYVPGVKDVKYLLARVVAEVSEREHANNAGQGSEQSERGVALQLGKNHRESFCHISPVLDNILKVNLSQSGCAYLAIISNMQLSCKCLSVIRAKRGDVRLVREFC
jgi:hypothetical protein